MSCEVRITVTARAVSSAAVIVELRVGELDELRQRGVGEIAVLMLTALIRVRQRDQFREQIELAAEQHELAEERTEGLWLIARKSAIVLKSGFRCAAAR